MKVVVNGGAGFSADLNPRGLHEKSGVRQWENETLVATKFVSEGRGYWKILELPARSTRAQPFRGKYWTLETAEGVILDQWGDRAITVQPEDITEEIARRKAIEAQEETERLADEEAWAYEANDGSFGTAKWT